MRRLLLVDLPGLHHEVHLLERAVLSAISMVIRDAHAQGTPVNVCGEMAGDGAGALLLLGLGVDTLSMSPASFGRVKRVIRGFTSKRARALAGQALGKQDEGQVRGLLDDALEGAGILKHRLRTGPDAGHS